MPIAKKCLFTCFYRSPIQNHEELESFCCSLDSLLSNVNDQHPAFAIAIEDFNAKYSKRCTSVIDNTAGLKLDCITTAGDYSQMINKPTHFINASSSCKDLKMSPQYHLRYPKFRYTSPSSLL